VDFGKLGGIGALALGLLWACVGDDPAAVDGGPGPNDAGSSSGSSGTSSGTNGDAQGASNDAAADGGDATAGPCDPGKPFLAPEIAPDLNDANAQTISVRLSQNGLLAFYSRGPVGGDQDLYRATRTTANEPFGTGVKVEFVNGLTADSKPSVTADLNTLYYYKGRGGAASDIFRARRTANGYETLKLLETPVNTPDGSQDPFVSPDGSQLFFTTKRGFATSAEIWLATTPNEGGFAAASSVPAIGLANLVFVDTPVLSSDMLRLYFGGGANADTDTGIWMTRRTTPNGAFGVPEKIKGSADLDIAGQRDEPSFITPDECILYMYSNRSGTFQTYRARRER
jgi:hypothetical protein